MHIKATIVAYVFSVQYFKNVTIRTYVDLRDKHKHTLKDSPKKKKKNSFL